MATTERGFTQNVWDFICSLKLTLTILISLALTSIIGTVLPQMQQGQLPPEYVAQISQTKLQIYTKLGFFDMYHSWWFVGLLSLFSVNLICCSIKRLPHVFKFVSEPSVVLGDSIRNSFSQKKEIHSSTTIESLQEKLSSFLSAEFSSPVITKHNDEIHLFAQKTAWCRLGVYVVHFSILVIFVGAIIGTLFGYKGMVNIMEGTAVNAVEGRDGKQIPLGFEVLCEKFAVEFYNTGAPKEFRSILTIRENGQPVPGYSQVKVIVNKPLSYKGVTFYQSSYGQATEGSEHRFTLRPKGGGTSEPFVAKEGQTITLKNGVTFKVLESAQEVRQFMPEFSGPAARVEVVYPGKPAQTFVVLKNYPELNAQRGDDLIFSYDGTDARMYTGLQVAKDPGVWTVWLGCTLMVIGLYIAFFMSHKRVWIVISKGRAQMFGNASKNQAAFSIQFDNLSDKLQNLKL